MRSPLDDFLKTVAILDELGLKYQINITSGEGFEYYTGIIFQLFMGKEKIGGGGRYDALISSMGGGNVPASGFALYLDRLMSLVKPETIAPPVPQRILVRVLSGDSVKEAFKAADSLRKAGYIAETDLDGRGARWILEVQSKTPMFTLVDAVKSRKTGAKSLGEVLKLLEGKGGD